MSDADSTAPVEYRPIPGFFGYRVGSDGSVWTCLKKGGNARIAGVDSDVWRRMRIHRHGKGYCRVNLIRDGKNYPRLVHQLVLEAFVGPCPDGMEGCHYPDQDKTNNAASNLRWDTHPENMKDAYRDLPPVTQKTCKRCGITKPASDFYKDKRASDGLKTECKACHCKIGYATADKDKRRATNRDWMRRARADA